MHTLRQISNYLASIGVAPDRARDTAANWRRAEVEVTFNPVLGLLLEGIETYAAERSGPVHT